MSVLKNFAGVVTLAGAALLPTVASAAAPEGVWINNTGRGAIEIKRCGGRLCGHVVWVKDTSDTKGCGRQIIGNLAKVRDGLWDRGWIYSPERKKRYDVEVRPLNNGNLRVKGYAGSKFFSKTMVWKPAPADLVRCSKEPKVVAAKAPAKSNKQVEVKKPAPRIAKAKVAEKVAKPDTAKARASRAAVAHAKKTKPARVAAVAPNKAVAAPASAAEKKAPAPVDAKRAAPTDTPVAKTLPPIVDPNDEQAEANEEGAGDGDDIDIVSEGGSGNGKLNFGDLDIGKYLKRTDSGKCKLDLPWVKLNFKCENL